MSKKNRNRPEHRLEDTDFAQRDDDDELVDEPPELARSRRWAKKSIAGEPDLARLFPHTHDKFARGIDPAEVESAGSRFMPTELVDAAKVAAASSRFRFDKPIDFEKYRRVSSKPRLSKVKMPMARILAMSSRSLVINKR
jgi:hypothetical protein